ncbi:MAG: 30S ribosomal protein S8 [bacterium]|nr:30S ribosomal protein S8 [bacterium]
MYINLLISIKNAARAGKASLKTPYTTMDAAVVEVLRRYGFVKAVEVKGRGVKRILDIEVNPDRPIRGVTFVSKPSLKRYGGYRALKPVKQGHGLLVLSTPRGVKSAMDARREQVGGQLLFEIW